MYDASECFLCPVRDPITAWSKLKVMRLYMLQREARSRLQGLPKGKRKQRRKPKMGPGAVEEARSTQCVFFSRGKKY